LVYPDIRLEYQQALQPQSTSYPDSHKMNELLQTITSHLNLLDLAKTTGIITVIGTIANWVTRSILNYTTSRYHSRLKTYILKVNLALPTELIGNIDFKCLIIRYGTDQYIQKMASEIDRQNGQLQNRIIDVRASSKSKDGGTEFTLALPVHSRMGTQFKCFAEVSNKVEKAQRANLLKCTESFLASSNIATDISMSSSEHEHRVFFLLNRFAAVTTVDGFQNNHCFPQ
jgi:hypothetical protein